MVGKYYRYSSLLLTEWLGHETSSSFIRYTFMCFDKRRNIRLEDVTTLHIEQIMKYNLNKGYSYSTLLKVKRLLVSFFSCYEHETPLNPMRQYQFYKKENVIATQANLRGQKRSFSMVLQQYRRRPSFCKLFCKSKRIIWKTIYIFAQGRLTVVFININLMEKNIFL